MFAGLLLKFNDLLREVFALFDDLASNRKLPYLNKNKKRRHVLDINHLM